MAMVSFNGRMDRCIKAFMKMMLNREKESFTGQMALFTREISKMVLNKAKE